MPRRRLTGRSALRIASGLLIVGLIGTTGCRWVPVRRINSTFDPRELGPVRTPESTSDAEGLGIENVATPLSLPPLPDQFQAEGPALASSSAPLPDTPLLDDALKRAQVVQDATIETPTTAFPVRTAVTTDDTTRTDVSERDLAPVLASPPPSAPIVVPPIEIPIDDRSPAYRDGNATSDEPLTQAPVSSSTTTTTTTATGPGPRARTSTIFRAWCPFRVRPTPRWSRARRGRRRTYQSA